MASVSVWIDVGGTFTDCFARHHNTAQLRSCKLLSSGKIPLAQCCIERAIPNAGEAEDVKGWWQLSSPTIQFDVDNFWRSASLHGVDAGGNTVVELAIIASAPGTLRFSLDHRVASELKACVSWEILPLTEAPVTATHRLLQVPLTSALPDLEIRLGTTKGTNALLTRAGAKTVFAVTAPFRELLEIGDQTRSELFALDAKRPPALPACVVEIEERLDANGHVLTSLNTEHAREQLLGAFRQGCSSLAVSLMHGYLNPAHERQVSAIAKEIGFEHVSVSSEVARIREFLGRSETTVIDAYLGPIVRAYLEKLRAQFEGWHLSDSASNPNQIQLRVMTSGGGLVAWNDFQGKDCVLSGPAGGVRALEALAKATSIKELIGFDMGGTSTDVCRVEGEAELEFESQKAGVRLLTPNLPVHTVAAGGGSICWFDGVSFRVGPKSAGAEPGPACYGRGGPLTVTDLNYWLGILPARQFPFELKRDAVAKRLDEILELCQASGVRDRDSLAAGFREVANEQMAEAVRSVSITKGVDPREHSLVGLGGASGQHLCAIATRLGIQECVDSEHSSLFSALGMGVAEDALEHSIPVYANWDECDWEQLKLEIESFQNRQPAFRSVVQLEVRYRGTNTPLTVAADEIVSGREMMPRVNERFHKLHRKRFGYAREQADVECVAVRCFLRGAAGYTFPKVEAVSTTEQLANPAGQSQNAQSTNREDFEGGTLVISRDDLAPGVNLRGPCTVVSPISALVVDAGWQAEMLSDGKTIRITRTAENYAPATKAALRPPADSFDPIVRDCYAQRLAGIAEQMGIVLERTAISVNVKQRRDFSCAVFDGTGNLLANAPHVPVHLGAMGETVKACIAHFESMTPGDAYVSNDPFRGGSHLPDITVVTPVFDASKQLKMFVANRAHHADVGGQVPGSMTVHAAELEEEGCLIAPQRLQCGGQEFIDPLVDGLLELPFPPRKPQEMAADLRAQLAANHRGAELLMEIAEGWSWEEQARYSEYLLEASAQRLRKFIEGLPDKRLGFSDQLDDGHPICVHIEKLSNDKLLFDFSGSGPVHPGSFNANPAIVQAAVYYVLRCLVADDLPLNDGLRRCLQLDIPQSLLNPKPSVESRHYPAVAAGNVETSQRIVDVLLGAFDLVAASQGTMNNFLFGNETFGFYETIGGGCGAGEGWCGEAAIHCHMTNTRLTDPEVLEANFPVRLMRCEIRQSSGGTGRFAGGDGMVREVQFLEPVTVSLLTSRRETSPYGLHGGRAGQPGRNLLVSPDGRLTILDACCQVDVQANWSIRLETPGGGGFGQSSINES